MLVHIIGMSFTEQIVFRAAPGFTGALDVAAQARGQLKAQFIRDTLAEALKSVGVQWPPHRDGGALAMLLGVSPDPSAVDGEQENGGQPGSPRIDNGKDRQDAKDSEAVVHG